MKDADELVGQFAAGDLAGVGAGIVGIDPAPPGDALSEQRAHCQQASNSRLLRTSLATTTRLVPDARVMGAAPA